ncbi:helix-turn-helix domain-containing protein, partial [Streptomyces lydicus]|uniref:helix-turn-helix domain-containing protein n=1 Tax=Streptomyces lydicus TaxID=47763 RepID=UPI00378800F4
MISSHRVRCRSAKTKCRYFVTKTKWTCIRKTQWRPVRMFSSIPINQLRIVIRVQLRYSFLLYPSVGQRAALARAFGCARVVYNDALRARETARSEGLPFLKTGDLSKALITEAKITPERAWLGEVSAVVLQQSLRDLDAAYRNFFDGLKGKRPRMGAP